MISKADLRRQMKALEKDGACDAALIWDKIEALPEFRQASTILLYSSMPGEVPTDSPLGLWDKNLAVPKVDGMNLVLKIFDTDKLEKGYMGIMEPTDEADNVSPEDIDLAIVPGVAFDRNKHRLGHGKGFYDRLLSELKCPVIGVCQKWRLVDEIPCDEWDIPMDMVITDLP